ncbi:MAG: DUF262 domain-containing protein [Magnetococcales bacterium]|nr:DUF262 domain-containing protein [Magnetococcales bacterium]
MSLDTLIRRMKEGEIELSPDFQRNEVWQPPAKSRLIESLLIRIPLPAFYMDATNEDRWLVVDGLQRLSTLRDFVIPKSEDKRLRLVGLEFLTELSGKGFDELPRNYQRRIEETQVTVYLIEEGTPPEVKFNIFKRINTGGLPLSPQEIRHAMNQGPVTGFLKELAESQEFRDATKGEIWDNRMSDREFVLRFFAFVLIPDRCNEIDDDTFLMEAMDRLNKMSDQERQVLKLRFYRVLLQAGHFFVETGPFWKDMFVELCVSLNELTEDQINFIIENKKEFKFSNDSFFLNDVYYDDSFCDPQDRQSRFSYIRNEIQDFLQKKEHPS